VVSYACEAGLKPSEFWDMTFGEIEVYCKGYEIRIARANELPRAIAGILFKANGGKGEITEFFPLITDKRRKKEPMTADEYNDFLKRLGYGKEEA
jgi:hypothetical protein